MPRKSPTSKTAVPVPAPKKRRGCIGRMLIGAAALFGILIAFTIVMGVIQSVGQSVGLLPTRAPTPTHTVTPTRTPTPSDPPTAVAQARGGAVEAVALAPADATAETPAALPTETPTNMPTPAPTDTATPADTSAPTTTPAVPPTNTRAPTPTKSATPTRTPTPRPTAAPTNTPTIAPTPSPTSAPMAGSVASTNANLRAGPGTDYTIVGGATAGDPLAITGVSGDGQWYQLASGVWVAASLVGSAPDAGSLVVVAAPTVAPADNRAGTGIGMATAAPLVTAEPPAAPSLRLGTLNYDGAVPDVESDEFMEIVNGSTEINLTGWVLRDDDGNQFTFPTYTMAPGTTCRVYTNEVHLESCGFSFNNGGAIWGNSGDMVLLVNPTGQVVDRQCWEGGC